MGFFKKVEGDGAVLVVKGRYKQVELYTRDGYLYAKDGGGFVRLMADGATSHADTRLDFLSWEGPLAVKLGRLAMDGTTGTKPLSVGAAAKLLGGPDGGD